MLNIHKFYLDLVKQLLFQFDQILQHLDLMLMVDLVLQYHLILQLKITLLEYFELLHHHLKIEC